MRVCGMCVDGWCVGEMTIGRVFGQVVGGCVVSWRPAFQSAERVGRSLSFPRSACEP